LLAFSRQQVLQPRVINLNKVLDSVEKMLRRLIGEDITLVAHRTEELAYVKADPGQLENVLMNLAVNARDAMPSGGVLTIRTGNTTVPEGDPAVPAGNYVELSVTDTGMGMSEAVKAQIFEPFFTTKEVGRGTGLGLATCYGIVKQSGGFITVDSEVHKGSTFYIYLPAMEGGESAEKGTPDAGALPHGSETVLVVEDESNVRGLTVHALLRLGYIVEQAANGEEAFQLLRTSAALGRLDLLITDVVMPQMGGKDLALWIRTSHPETKILFISGYPNHAFDDSTLLDENTAFMAKPYTAKALALKVRELLDRKPEAAPL
jgi:CheY-like chemotaxis protein